MPERNQGSALDRFLRLFTDVKAGEGQTALLLALNVFLILMAYYVLKPVREALILGEGSAELKTLHVGRRRWACWRSWCRSTAAWSTAWIRACG